MGEKLLPHERVFDSVALSVKDQQVAVMDESVNHCGGHRFVKKDIDPLAELKVCGEDQTAFFVAG